MIVFPNTIYWGKKSVFFSPVLYQLCCFIGSIIFGLSWVTAPSGWRVYHPVLTPQLSDTYRHMGGKLLIFSFPIHSITLWPSLVRDYQLVRLPGKH